MFYCKPFKMKSPPTRTSLTCFRRRWAFLVGFSVVLLVCASRDIELVSRHTFAKEQTGEENELPSAFQLAQSNKNPSNNSPTGAARRTLGAIQKLERFHFLGIGVSQHQDTRIQTARETVKSVQQFEELFSQQGPDDAQAFQTRSRTLFNDDATKTNVERALADLPNCIENQGNVVIVFSGHSAHHGRDWNFVTYDADPDHVLRTCLTADSLMYYIDALIKARDCRVMLIVDTNFGSSVARSAERLLGKYSDPTRGGVIMLLSNIPGEIDRDPHYGGLFASMLIDGLDGLGKLTQSSHVKLKDLRRFFQSESPIQTDFSRRLVLIPGIGIPDQVCRIESSMSILEELQLTKADPKKAIPLETRFLIEPRFTPGCVTVIETTKPVVGVWSCRMRVERTLQTETSQSDAEMSPVNRELIYSQELTLELTNHGDYIVRYRDPLGNAKIVAGRYRYQSGSEFSFADANGVEYFSLDHLTENQMEMSIPECRSPQSLQVSKRWVFDRIQSEIPQ